MSCSIVSRLVLLLVPAFASAAEPAARPTFDRPQDASYELSGPLRRQVDAVVANWLLRAPDDNPAMLQMFSDRDKQPYRDLLPWSGEFAGKYLTGATQVLRLTGDAKLKARLETFVRDFVACQDADGYLGPFPKDSRLTGRAPNVGGDHQTWDAWGHYHAMVGLLAWYDLTGDAAALAAARRVGDLLCATFLDAGKTVASTGSVEMNHAVVHSLALLHHRTREQRYLELAQRIVGEFALPSAGDYVRAALAGKEFFQSPKPRWESLHPIMGLAELHYSTGDARYRDAFERLWWSIAKLDRHNNGGFSSGEQAQGNPYHRGAIETCCTIAWIAMSVEMLRLTGDSVVADELELSTLNQVVALHAPDGKWSTYNTPMDGLRVPSTKDIAFQIRPGSEQLNCCSVNAARGFGMITDWAWMQDGAGLVLNWYGPSTLTAKAAGDVRVTLRQVTRYPNDGHVELSVDLARPARFTLKLRIPHWSATTKVSVNGAAVRAAPGTYLSLDRTWHPGDRVTLDFDFSPRFWVGERESEGKVSAYRGPLLLVHESAAPPTEFDKDWQTFGALHATRKRGAVAQRRFDGDIIVWRGARFDDAGRARVAIDGREVEVVDQYGPKRDAPFAWERKGLGPGPHTIRIETLGEKAAASTGTWVNVASLGPPDELPVLDARRVAAASLVTPTGDAPELLLDVDDANGPPTRLLDFARAGFNRLPYVSWLRFQGLAPAPFSRTNPSRTTRPAE